MNFGLDPNEHKELIQRQRAHFWSRLGSILKDHHAPGHVQSDVRYATAHWRRVSSRGRERALLTLYSLVGYGERIGWPLGWLILLSLLLTPLFISPQPQSACCALWPEALSTFWDVLRSPSGFFRLGPSDLHASGFWEELALLLASTVGIVLLFFSVSAIRRVTKAE